MEFITLEQFKEQPAEIQKVFLNWWKPSNGDLYIDAEHNGIHDTDGILVFEEFMDDLTENELCAYKRASYSFKCNCIPLLTEGQLRKFIEEKADGIVKVIQWHIEDSEVSKRGYAIDILRRNEYHVTYHYQDLGQDLLQAYWKVACMIAKEEIE